MALKYFIIVAITILSVANARSIRDTSAQQPISDFIEDASKNLKTLETNFLKLFGFDNVNQLEEKVIEQRKKYVSEIDEWANNIKVETEALKDNESIKELRQSLDKAIDELKQKHPNTSADIKQHFETFGKGVESVISQVKDLGQSQEAKNIQEVSKKILDNTSQTFQNISNKIKEDISQ